ncbi:MAG TPA: cobalamin-binding protein [Vicinamibacterales bacterium]|nr:cobalamin-binding protein [Vicinamibacterales bacterium]
MALAPSITETIYSINAGDAVAGVTDFTDWPPEATQRPSVGGIVNPSIERLVSLRPDLVIATREANHMNTIDELDRLGVPVFVVDPQGLDGVLESVRQVGRALNRSGDADRLVDRLRARRDAVVTRVRGLARPRVLLVIWPEPVTTIGRQAFITDVINAAGGQSVTEDLPQQYPRISLEEVLRRNPDWLLLPANGHQPISLADLEKRPGWDRLEAVRRHRVLYYDERLDHSSPRAFDALEDVAKQLHANAFSLPQRPNSLEKP